MKKIWINVDKYAKHESSTRLSIFLLDEHGNCGGTRIKGPKYNDFSANNEIKIALDLKQATELRNELDKCIKELNREATQNE